MAFSLDIQSTLSRHQQAIDTALRLARWFGTSPQFWLNLQSAHDLRVAEDRAGDEIARIPVRPDAA